MEKTKGILIKFNIILLAFVTMMIIIGRLISSYVLAETASADGQEVTLGIKSTPKIDIALAKARTSTNVDGFDEKIKQKMQELGIDTTDTKVDSLEAEQVTMSESFAWQEDKDDSIGTIEITENGKNVEMKGNNNKPGKNAMWIIPDKNQEQKFTFGYNIDFGDSFNAAGMLLRVKQKDDSTLTGYMFSFITQDSDGRAWRTAAGEKNGALWTFTYDMNNDTNITKEIVEGIDIATEGQLTVSATDSQIRISGGEMQQDYVYDIPEEKADIVGNGYGFFSDHFSHSCENIGSFKLTDINLEETTVRKVTEVLREPQWRANSYKFFVFITDETVKELEESNTGLELLTRIINENTYFVPWGTSVNQKKMEDIIKNCGQGKFIDNNQHDFDASLQSTAEYIKEILGKDQSTTLLLNEPMELSVTPESIKTGTATGDGQWKNGKWKVTHDENYFDNSLGQFAQAGKYTSDLITQFDKPGKYTLTYEDKIVKPEEILVHRRPTAIMNLSINDTTVTTTSESYDLDKMSEKNKGIEETEWKYKATDETEWKKEKLTTINKEKDYIVQLRVKDLQDTWSYPVTKYITSDTTALPVAMFNLVQDNISKYEKIEINDSSYDPVGRDVTNYKWELYKTSDLSNAVYTKEVTSQDMKQEVATNYTFSDLNFTEENKGAGQYMLYLTVTDDQEKKSERFGRMIEVTDDVDAPEVTVTPMECEWKKQETVELQFSDRGGSQFKEYKYAITDSQDLIQDEASWSEAKQESNGSVEITGDGQKYLHVKGYDNANNESQERVVGPYRLDNSAPTVEIIGNRENQTTEPVQLTFNSMDTLSGIKEVRFNNQVLEGKGSTTTKVIKNGTYKLEVEDNVGNVHSEEIEISNIYQHCVAGLNHPDYPTNVEECPICKAIKGLSVEEKNKSVVYNAKEQHVKYELSTGATIVEYYNGAKIVPIDAGNYRFELKVEYNGEEYRTGIEGLFIINPKELTIENIEAVSREYDGTNIVQLRGGNLVGVETEDTNEIGFNLPETGTVGNKNVGKRYVMIPEITLNGSKAKNYTLTQPKVNAVIAEITKKKVSSEEDDSVRIEGIEAISREYDGTNIVEIQGGTLLGIEDCDKGKVSFILPQTGIADGKDAGEHNVSISEIQLSGQEAGNYELTQPKPEEVTVSISKRKVALDYVKGKDKRYDRTDVVDIISGELQNVIEGEDVVAVIPEKGIAKSSHVGTWAVEIDEIALSGNDMLNYELIQPDPENITVNILRPYQPKMHIEPYISKVNDKELKEAIPLASIGNGKIDYTKGEIEEPIRYADQFTISLRIYNEGVGAGYIKTLTNTIPDGLKFVEDNETNKEYKWEEISNNKISTNCLGFDSGIENEIVPPEEDVDYREVSFVVEVTQTKELEKDLENVTTVASVDIDNLDTIEEVPEEKLPVVSAAIQESGWKNTNKYVTVIALDETEKGIAGYAITKDKKEPKKWENSTETTWTSEAIYDEGTYYAWVKDKEGKVSKCKEFNVNKIDKESPVITDFIKNGNTLTGKAKDDKSGVSEYQFSTKEVNENSGNWKSIYNPKTTEIERSENVKNNQEYNFYVKDQAGNIAKSKYSITTDQNSSSKQSVGKDTNGDGKPDAWDTNGDGKTDSWDTDGDGKADSFDKNGDGLLNDDENNSKHPELGGRDQNGGKDTTGNGIPDRWDTDGDGKDDAWDTNGDGKPDAWDTDGDGNADSFDENGNGKLDEDEKNSEKPGNGRTESGGKDTNGDGKPDAWDRDGDGKDDAWDTDVPPDGKPDSYDKDGNGKLDDDEDNSKHPELNGRDENGGRDTDGDGKSDAWDTNNDGKDDAWDTNGDGKKDAWDTDGDGNADSYDQNGNGELDDNENNSKQPGNGRNENGGKDTNGDGKVDAWDTNGDGKDDAWDTDGDGNADSYDENGNGKLDDEENNSKKPGSGKDENNGKDTNKDGKADAWDTDGDGKDDAWDTDGDGNADSYDKNGNGELDDNENSSKHPELNGRDQNGGRDTNGDGKPDAWDKDGDGKDDAWDRNGDGKEDAWDTDKDGKADSFDKDKDGKLDDEEDNSKHPELNGRDENGGHDTDGDGKPDAWDKNNDGKDDAWDTDGDGKEDAWDTDVPPDGKADSFDKDGDGELDDEEDNSKHSEELKGRDENGGRDTDGDGKVDAWDTDGDGKDDAWDTDGDGKADSFDEDNDGELDDDENNSKKPGNGKDENGGKDTNGDGKPDAWDTDGDGKDDAWDTDGDGNADSFDKDGDGELDDNEDNSKHPELNGRDENGGRDTDGDGKPDAWDKDNDGKDDAWDTNGDGKEDAWDTSEPKDGKADSFDKDGDGELDDEENNSKHPELNGRDENGGRDTDGDGKVDAWDTDDDGQDDAWDTNGDGKPDAWDTNGDGNADSFDKDKDGKLDDEEDNSKHPELNGKDENGGHDTDGDGKVDAWDTDGDGKDDAWDTDGDGKADSFDKDGDGELDDNEDNSKHPELNGRDEEGGRDTDGDGKVDAWDTDNDGKDDAWDTDGDGKKDAWDTDEPKDGKADSFDKDGDGELDDNEDNSKHPDTLKGRDENGGRDTDGDGKVDAWDTDGNGQDDAWDTDGDGKPDSWDTDGDGKADSYDKNGNGELDKEEDNRTNGGTGRDKEGGHDTDGDGKVDAWDKNGDGKDDAWDTDGDGKEDAWDTDVPPDGKADSFDKDGDGELDDEEDNSQHSEELKGRDENGGRDTDGDGKVDAWDTDGDGQDDAWDRDGDGKPDAWDTDGDGNADSYDKNKNGQLDADENSSQKPGNGKDENNGKDTNGDGKVDSWDTNGDGKDDAWDTDGDGNADSFDKDGDGELDDNENNSLNPQLNGRDENGGRDTNGDGKPDAWDKDGDGKDDAWDTDGDGKEDAWDTSVPRDGKADSFDRNGDGLLNDDENNSKHPELNGRDEEGGRDTDGDGKPDAWDTDNDGQDDAWDTDGDGKKDAWDTDEPKDGKADSFDKNGNGELDDEEDNSKHPDELKGRDENGGKDNNGDGKPDSWDTDGDGKDDAWDTDVPPDGKADSYDKDNDGKLDDNEDNSKHPELNGRDEEGGRDTDGDGKPDAWDTDNDGKDDAWDTDGDGKKDAWDTDEPKDGKADSFDKDGDGELDDNEDNSKHPEELKGRDENGGRDTDGDGKPDAWDTDGDGRDDAWDTDGDGKPDSWDTNKDGSADSFDKNGNGELDPSEDNRTNGATGRDKNGGRDTNGDGKPDAWDTNGDGKDDAWDRDGDGKPDAWDTDVPPDGKADSFDKNGNGTLDENENNSKHPELDGRDENGGRDTNGDGKPDAWDKDGDGKDDAWDRDGDGKEDAWDTSDPRDGNADSFDKNGNGELDDEEDNSKHSEELKGRDENGGRDTNGDGKPDAWDTDGDGKDDAWDTDEPKDGKADSFDKDKDGELDDNEDNSKHPELNGRDEEGGRDTDGDGKVDAWDTDGDGKDDAWDTDGDGKPDSWDTDGDGKVDSFDENGNGKLDNKENNSKHPELNGRDKDGGRDTNGDGKVDAWDTDGDGRDDAWDTDGDGKPDSWDTDGDGSADSYDKNGNGELDKEEDNRTNGGTGRNPEGGIDTDGDGKVNAWDTDGDGKDDAWDTDGDGKPDAWDTNGDGNADSFDRNGDGLLNDDENSSLHPELKGRDENGGKDTNGDGKPDSWDTDGDGKDDSWDTDVPPDGKADSFDKDGDGELDDNEDNSKHPDELNGRDENNGRDTDGDGKVDAWDTDGDGKDDAWDTDGDGKKDAWDTDEPKDGKADSFDKNGNGELDSEEDNSKHPELDGRDENGGKDNNGDGKPDSWDTDGDGQDDAWDTDGDGKPDAWDTDGDGNADSYDKNGNGELDKDEDNRTNGGTGRDKQGGRDTDGDGKVDAWDKNGDGKDDAWDTDGDGKEDAWDTDVPPDRNADSFDKNGNGQLDEEEDNSKNPELNGRDENGGKDTNGDGKPDRWDTDGDGKDDSWDTDVPPDGKADSYDKDGDGNLDDNENNSKHPELNGRDPEGGRDTNGDGKVDAWDTNGDGKDDTWDTDGDGKKDAWDTDVPPDGKADSYDKDGDGELDDDEDNSKNPELNGRDEDGGRDTDGDGKPDAWDTDGDGQDDAWDTDGDGKPDAWDKDGDGNADSYDENGNGQLDPEEDNGPKKGDGKDENRGTDTNGDGKPDAWDTDGDGKDDAWDTDGDGNADSYDKDGDGELDDNENNSKNPSLNGRDKNGGRDTNGDGKPDAWDEDKDGRDDAWDTDEDGKPDAWDTDKDGKADSYDKNGNGELDESENNSKHPGLNGRDENGGRDTNGDGKPDSWDTDGDGQDDAWDTNGDGKPDAWDTDVPPDGKADSFDKNDNGVLDNEEDNSKHPELEGRDENGGKDNNGDGKPDSWDTDGDGKDDAWDTDVPPDGKADSYDKDGDGELDDDEDNSRHPDTLNGRDENGGRDTDGDGKVDAWDTDVPPDNKDDAWDTDGDGKPDAWDTNKDGKADSYDKDGDGELDDNEDNSKHPELNGRDPEGGRDTDGDGKVDAWDTNDDGQDDAWDTDGDGKPDAWDTDVPPDGNADSYDKNGNGELDPEEDNSTNGKYENTSNEKDVTVTFNYYDMVSGTQKSQSVIGVILDGERSTTIQVPTVESINTNIFGQTVSAKPRGWSTSPDADAAIEVELAQDEITVNRSDYNKTYYMSYEHDVKYKVNTIDSTTNSTQSDIKQLQIFVNSAGVNKGDNQKVVLPQVTPPEGWTFNGWTKDDEEPNGSLIDVQAETPAPDAITEYHASYKKEITVRRFIYKNTELENLTGSVYKNDVKVNKAKFKLGTIQNIQISQDASGTPLGRTETAKARGWSTVASVTGEVDVPSDDTTEIELDNNATYYASYNYGNKYKFISHDGSEITGTSGTNVDYLGNLVATDPEKDKFPNIPQAPVGWSPRGWVKGTSANGDIIDTSSTKPESNVTYYATYEKQVTANRYEYLNKALDEKTGTAYKNSVEEIPASIDLDTVGNASMQTAGSGDSLTTPINATPRFWSTSQEPDVEDTTATSPSTNEDAVSLSGTAHLTEDKTYYMSYDFTANLTYNDGTSEKHEGKSAKVAYNGKTIGDEIDLQDASVPSSFGGNCTFEGWTKGFEDPKAEKVKTAKDGEANPDRINPEVTYYATFKKEITISFNENQGDTPAPGAIVSYKYKNAKKETTATVTMPSVGLPTREGYNFLGWDKSAQNSTAQYQTGQSYEFEDSTTLYAIWKEIDRQPPTINFQPNGGSAWEKSYTTKVTVTDNEGVDDTKLKYLWSTESSQPDKGDFTETFASNDDITLEHKSGKYYLWVIAEDINGNENIQHSDVFNVDNDGPGISSATSEHTVAKAGGVKITGVAQDQYSGIVAYQFSQSPDLNADSGNWNEIGGATNNLITKDEYVKEPGNWYFYVKDSLGNYSSQRIEVLTTDFDNIQPTINISLNDATEYGWAKSATVTITYPDIDGLTKTYTRGDEGGDQTANSNEVSFQVSENNTSITAKSKLESQERDDTDTVTNVDNKAPTARIDTTNLESNAQLILWFKDEGDSTIDKYKASLTTTIKTGDITWGKDRGWISPYYLIIGGEYFEAYNGVWGKGSLTVELRDKAGNTYSQEFEVAHEDTESPEIEVYNGGATYNGDGNCMHCSEDSYEFEMNVNFKDNASGASNIPENSYIEVHDNTNQKVIGHVVYEEVVPANQLEGTYKLKVYIHKSAGESVLGTFHITFSDYCGNPSEQALFEMKTENIEPILSIDKNDANASITVKANDLGSGIRRWWATITGKNVNNEDITFSTGTLDPMSEPGIEQNHTFNNVWIKDGKIEVTAIDRAGNVKTITDTYTKTDNIQPILTKRSVTNSGTQNCPKCGLVSDVYTIDLDWQDSDSGFGNYTTGNYGEINNIDNRSLMGHSTLESIPGFGNKSGTIRYKAYIHQATNPARTGQLFLKFSDVYGNESNECIIDYSY